MAKTSPMMEQYFEIKNQYPDHILLYRVGDFYEMFYDDAITVSAELDMTLTGKDCGQAERAPMCGMPHHSCDTYIARLVANGHKVCICEQVEDPKSAKGIVKREVVKVITPGTVTDSNMLDSSKNNFLCAISESADNVSLCFADISTGELFLTVLDDCEDQDIINELCRFSPKEILTTAEVMERKELLSYCDERIHALVSLAENEKSVAEMAKFVLEHFGVTSLTDIQIDGDSALFALYLVLDYALTTQRCDISFMNKLEVYSKNQFMELDISTRRNLEITESMRHGTKQGSLISVLDKTKTSMGGRKLRTVLERPLIKVADIEKRLSAVEQLKNNVMYRDRIIEALNNINDLERLMTRLMLGSGNAKDLIAFKNAFSVLPVIKSALSGFSSELLTDLNNSIVMQNNLADLISAAIIDNPPFTVKEGGIIRDGFDESVDENRLLMRDAKTLVVQLEQAEKERTGIKNLKIGYNRVFGYYIEVTKMYYDLIPENYIRKQTLANCERFITQELKDMETKILYASERVQAREYEIFCGIRELVKEQFSSIKQTSEALAMLDVLVSLAVVAHQNNYVRPTVDVSDEVSIVEGRHPVVESVLKDSFFVPNDMHLDCRNNRMMILTGPNMSGKSTYMRQNAMIILMAQIGSFVPAKSARIGVVDKIFTRVGASDDLASGQSTFMLEMLEVANILKNATSKSFLVFDEIGRGTSTYDGMSIAKAVVEFVANRKKIGAKTLFATHYHELCELENTVEGVVNFNVAVKKRGDDIVFLKKIIPGGTDDSFGIEVAALAGVDNWIVKRAKQILKELEQDGKIKIVTRIESDDQSQMSLTDFSNAEIIDKLKSIDVSTITPIEAMSVLYELSNKAKQ